MIEVEKLCKSYGLARALNGISFRVGRGEVVGFLGPNGAGKSTTMKILTGFLLPTSGRARVDGRDVVEDSLAVRRRIGYLPESTPLYTEMRVDEYLAFAAAIRGVAARDVRSAVAKVIGLCGLDRVVGKNILELSKGYRQRVGLAQALVHDPELLILDEPTSGLDPNQIVEVRDLIAELRERHTVVLSTHYLQEVEASCSRIIVIDLGEIVADDTAEGLIGKAGAGAVRCTLKADPGAVHRQLGELFPGRTVTDLGRDGDYASYRVEVGTIPDYFVEDSIAQLAVKNGWSLAELSREKPTLEAAFRKLTLGRRGEVEHA